jgi:hypothetical protein
MVDRFLQVLPGGRSGSGNPDDTGAAGGSRYWPPHLQLVPALPEDDERSAAPEQGGLAPRPWFPAVAQSCWGPDSELPGPADVGDISGRAGVSLGVTAAALADAVSRPEAAGTNGAAVTSTATRTDTGSGRHRRVEQARLARTRAVAALLATAVYAAATALAGSWSRAHNGREMAGHTAGSCALAGQRSRPAVRQFGPCSFARSSTELGSASRAE